jgi:hypothetical protein
VKEREQPTECDREGCTDVPTHIEYAWAVAGDDRLFLCRPHAQEARDDTITWGGEPMGDGLPVEDKPGHILVKEDL